MNYDYTMSHSSPVQALEVDDLKLGDIGPKFEHHEMFPSRTNTGSLNNFFHIHILFFTLHVIMTVAVLKIVLDTFSM